MTKDEHEDDVRSVLTMLIVEQRYIRMPDREHEQQERERHVNE
jgi:hypothetical protein